MSDVPQISHSRAVKAFQRAGFTIIRQGKHVSMAKGDMIIIIPRQNPIKKFTLKGIIRDADLTIDAFKKLL